MKFLVSKNGTSAAWNSGAAEDLLACPAEYSGKKHQSWMPIRRRLSSPWTQLQTTLSALFPSRFIGDHVAISALFQFLGTADIQPTIYRSTRMVPTVSDELASQIHCCGSQSHGRERIAVAQLSTRVAFPIRHRWKFRDFDGRNHRPLFPQRNLLFGYAGQTDGAI